MGATVSQHRNVSGRPAETTTDSSVEAKDTFDPIPTEDDIVTLVEYLEVGGINIDVEDVGRVDAAVVHRILTSAESFVEAATIVLESSWDRHCGPSNKECYLYGMVLKMVADCTDDLFTLLVKHATEVVSIVAESEIDLLNCGTGHSSSGGGSGGAARNATNRAKAKLLIQERSEVVSQGMRRELAKKFAPFLDKAVDLIKILREELSEIEKEFRETDATIQGQAVLFRIRRDEFSRRVSYIALNSVDTPTIAESCTFLQRALQRFRDEPGSKSSNCSSIPATTRSRLHASRLLAYSAKARERAAAQAASRQGPSPPNNDFVAHGVLVAEAQPETKELLHDRSQQLEALLKEIHSFGTLPKMNAMLTNTSGSQVIEFDIPLPPLGGTDVASKGTPSAAPQSIGREHNFRLSDLHEGYVLSGKYCRVSPLVLMLLGQTKTDAKSGVSVFTSETITLVLEEDPAPAAGSKPTSVEVRPRGWRNLATGVVYDTTIPSGGGDGER
jgi:hypothetical protein